MIKLLLLTSFAFSGNSAAQDEAPMMDKGRSGIPLEEVQGAAMCNPDGIGVGGYDLVSYHRDGGPVAGDAANSADHDGVTYQFASQENLDLFVREPTAFLPAYSGYCAITLAFERVTCPDFTNFKIEDGRLLLFEVTGFTNGRTLWNSDTTGFRVLADENFKKLSVAR